MPFTTKKTPKRGTFNKPVLLVFLISLILYACHKDSNAPSANRVDPKIALIQRLQQEFNKNAYSKSALDLEQPLRINVKLVWEINWSSQEIKPDSANGIIYVYIPYKPHIERSGKTLPISNINYQRYLLASIKDKKIEFSSAYVNPDSNSNSVKFTGLLTVKSLDRKVGGLFAYNSGKMQPEALNALKSKAAGLKQRVNGLSVNQWCDLYNCTWSWDCVDWFEGTFNGAVQNTPEMGGCTVPPTGMPTGNPLTICPSVNGWILIHATIGASFCDPTIPPPPPPPTQPGGGGTTGGTVSNSDIILATPIYDGRPGIDPLTFIKCFTDGKTASKYVMTVYVQQPIPGSNDQWTITAAYNGMGGIAYTTPENQILDVGHTFVGFTKFNTDGTYVTQVMGFYPATNGFLPGWQSKGVIKDDSGHPYDVSYTTTVNATQFNAALGRLTNDSANANYTLSTGQGSNPEYNCTDAALTWMSTASVNLPANAPRGIFNNTPGDYGQALRSFNGATTVSSTAPSGHGACN